jgi:hypothetical protein
LARVVFEVKHELEVLGPAPKDPAELSAYDKRAQDVLRPLASGLMKLSKCPDYVVNRGHYFGTGYDNEPALSDTDKRALIEFLKHF